MFGKQKAATLVAEFLGTGILTLLVLSVQRSTIGVPFFVAIAAGLAVMGGTFAFGNISGAVFNPAIAIAMWTVKKLSAVTTVLYIGAEMLGAWLAYYLYAYLVNTKVVAINPHFNGRTLAAEAFGAFILGLFWAAGKYQKWNKNVLAPVVGLSLIVAIIAASAGGVGVVNPAVALGIRAWCWGTYVLGPILGAVVGFNLYAMLFASKEELDEKVKAVDSTTKTTSEPVKKAPANKPAAKKATKRTTSKKK